MVENTGEEAEAGVDSVVVAVVDAAEQGLGIVAVRYLLTEPME